MIVVDASVILELLLVTGYAARVEERIFRAGTTLHAPHLLDLEIAQVLRRYGRSGELSPERAVEALSDFADLPINRHPHAIFLSRIWELRGNLTVYDAAYVVLAEALEAPLLTRDAKLAAAGVSFAAIEILV